VGVLQERAAKSGAVGGENCNVDADLAEVVEAWPALPDAAKATVLAIVRSACSA
jgi:hypothetical protein